MTTNSNGTTTTNNDMIPTRDELINYIDAIRRLIVYKAADIKAYKPTGHRLIYHNDKISGYVTFVDEFAKIYPDYSL